MSNEVNQSIQNAVEAFQKQMLVGMPTETVYGLAAPINDEKLIQKIFQLKERPFFDPLIVHVDSIEMAKSVVKKLPELAQKIASAFWPGPLTMVLEKDPTQVSDLITSGLSTVGVRCPNHPIAIELIKAMKTPLAAPSANKFTKVSPTAAEHVRSEFSGEDVFVLDGGSCQIGIESTIIAINDDQVTLLRPGMVTVEQIENVTGTQVKRNNSKVVSPGSMKIHYRPKFPLIIGETLNANEEFCHTEELNGDPTIVARNIYKILRMQLPQGKEKLFLKIAKSDYESEKWEGIVNRLKKAASLNLFDQ